MPGFLNLTPSDDARLQRAFGEAHEGVHTPSHAIADSSHVDAPRHATSDRTGRFAR
jgi:hypothetical protein